MLSLHPEGFREEASRIVAEMVAGSVAECPLPLITAAGHLIPAETRVVKGKWSGHDVLFGISKDLSALRASEERFAKAFHFNPSPMAITSLKTNRILDVNEAFLQTLGYERDEILDADPTALFADPERRVAALRIVQETGSLRDFQVSVRTKDGAIREGLFAAELIQLQDQRVLLTVMNDVTQRRQAEQELRRSEARYRLLIETIPQLAWRSSSDGLHVEFNRRWHEYTGQSPAQVHAHGWLAAVHPDDLFRVIHEALRMINAREPCEIEYRLRRASDGTYRWHLTRAVPTLSEDGEVTSWVGSATDIEDLKQAQELLKVPHDEQLQRHQAELAHVARLSMMGEMAASLAHELNQPLHAVTSYAYGSICRLERVPERDEEQIAALEQIIEEANRAAQIIRRIKAFVQKREGKFFTVLVNSLVEDAALLTRMAAEQYRTKVVLELAKELPPVTGDPIQIEQVVANLIRNGLEAMDTTPVDKRWLHIRTLRHDDDAIRVEVRDSGKGIRGADLGHIFEPFFTTKSEGMGMGLAISRSIVQAHGGRTDGIRS